MNIVKVIIYRASNGKEPFAEWLRKLDWSNRSVINARLRRIRSGNYGDCKSLKGVPSLWELRIDYGPGYRIYFARKQKEIVILLIGGDKKSQEKDILCAQKYWLDYKESL